MHRCYTMRKMNLDRAQRHFTYEHSLLYMLVASFYPLTDLHTYQEVLLEIGTLHVHGLSPIYSASHT